MSCVSATSRGHRSAAGHRVPRTASSLSRDRPASPICDPEGGALGEIGRREAAHEPRPPRATTSQSCSGRMRVATSAPRSSHLEWGPARGAWLGLRPARQRLQSAQPCAWYLPDGSACRVERRTRRTPTRSSSAHPEGLETDRKSQGEETGCPDAGEASEQAGPRRRLSEGGRAAVLGRTCRCPTGGGELGSCPVRPAGPGRVGAVRPTVRRMALRSGCSSSSGTGRRGLFLRSRGRPLARLGG